MVILQSDIQHLDGVSNAVLNHSIDGRRGRHQSKNFAVFADLGDNLRLLMKLLLHVNYAENRRVVNVL